MDLIDSTHYPLVGLDRLSSPRLLIWRAHVDANIAAVMATARRLGVALRPHAKTHKSVWATRRQLDAGITRFKATPNELDLLLRAGARDVLVAYPALTPLAERLARVARSRPDVRVGAQLGSVEHGRILAAAARRAGVRLDVWLDLDVGQRRTGAAPAAAAEIVGALAAEGALDGPLRLVGLHAYDGHNHDADRAQRRVCGAAAMGPVAALARQLAASGRPLETLTVGGSPGFEPSLEALAREELPDGIRLEASPGTWIYWDTTYDRLMPGAYRIAALLLARVMDRPGPGRITLDLGHKRWAVDQGPVERFSVPGLAVVAVNEEHTVLSHSADRRFAVGQPLLIAPRHVCPTVNLWGRFTLIGEDGRVALQLPVDGRND